jgi:hypothetical protein
MTLALLLFCMCSTYSSVVLDTLRNAVLYGRAWNTDIHTSTHWIVDVQILSAFLYFLWSTHDTNSSPSKGQWLWCHISSWVSWLVEGVCFLMGLSVVELPFLFLYYIPVQHSLKYWCYLNNIEWWFYFTKSWRNITHLNYFCDLDILCITAK